MPLGLSEHPHERIDVFLWGLLPDNEGTLNRLGRDHHVSPRSAFALISAVGEDCAGAGQFIRPERLEALNAAARAVTQWLTEKEIAERLRILRGNYAAGRLPRDEGQFSLAGHNRRQPSCSMAANGAFLQVVYPPRVSLNHPPANSKARRRTSTIALSSLVRSHRS